MQIVYIPSESMSVQGKKDEIYIKIWERLEY